MDGDRTPEVHRRKYAWSDSQQEAAARLCFLRGVNSMVKLLRAHGGCLGRNRR
jgi:hypothetical protein